MSSNANKRRWLMRVRRAHQRQTTGDGKTQTQMTSYFCRQRTPTAVQHFSTTPAISSQLPPDSSAHNSTVQQRMAAINPGRPPDCHVTQMTSENIPILSRASP
jgi:hypothetical protein